MRSSTTQCARWRGKFHQTCERNKIMLFTSFIRLFRLRLAYSFLCTVFVFEVYVSITDNTENSIKVTHKTTISALTHFIVLLPLIRTRGQTTAFCRQIVLCSTNPFKEKKKYKKTYKIIFWLIIHVGTMAFKFDNNICLLYL